MKYRIKDSMDFFNSLEDLKEAIEGIENLSMSDVEILTDAEYEALFEDEKIPVEGKDPIEFIRDMPEKDTTNFTRVNTNPEIKHRRIKGNKVFTEYVASGWEDLTDPEIPACPFCSKAWSVLKADAKKEELSVGLEASKKIAFRNLLQSKQEPQNTGTRNINKVFLDKGIPFRETHLFNHHPNLASYYEKIGLIQFGKVQDEFGNWVIKPQGNKQGVESLSVEELSERINNDPEKRKLFFRAWMRKLQERQ